MTQDEIIEMAIKGHASTRDAIRWAMNQKTGENMTHTKDEALNRAQSAISYTILALSNGNDLTYAKACLESALTAIKQALAAQPATKESSETQTASAYVKTYHGGKPWPLQPAPGRNHWEDGDVFERIATKAKGQP